VPDTAITVPAGPLAGVNVVMARLACGAGAGGAEAGGAAGPAPAAVGVPLLPPPQAATNNAAATRAAHGAGRTPRGAVACRAGRNEGPQRPARGACFMHPSGPQAGCHGKGSGCEAGNGEPASPAQPTRSGTGPPARGGAPVQPEVWAYTGALARWQRVSTLAAASGNHFCWTTSRSTSAPPAARCPSPVRCCWPAWAWPPSVQRAAARTRAAETSPGPPVSRTNRPRRARSDRPRR